jgi:flavin-dependent dehydrogenase
MMLSPLVLLLVATIAQDPQPARTPAQAELVVDADGARSLVTRGVRWLTETQHEDGSWGTGAIDSVQFVGFAVETYYDFQLGANATSPT